jgi:CRP/FNR family transcriptional regulator, cyclic AMP receptor protein
MSVLPNQSRSGHESPEMLRVLDEDPELATRIDATALAEARVRALAPLLTIAPQRASHVVDERNPPGHLGLLVIDGLIVRDVRFGAIGATEVLGPRDVIRPWRWPRSGTHRIETRWQVLSPARLAVLDNEFAIRVRPWPGIVSALLERGTERADSLLLQAALRQSVRVEDRLLGVLWHFAERWGEETDEGWRVSLPRLTGGVLASIVGARRQSVSRAVGLLADRQAIRREPDGVWILLQRSPELAARGCW